MTLRTWPALDQHAEALAVDAHVVGHDGQVLDAGVAHGLDQVRRDAAEAESADGERHAVAQHVLPARRRVLRSALTSASSSLSAFPCGSPRVPVVLSILWTASTGSLEVFRRSRQRRLGLADSHCGHRLDRLSTMWITAGEWVPRGQRHRSRREHPMPDNQVQGAQVVSRVAGLLRIVGRKPEGCPLGGARARIRPDPAHRAPAAELAGGRGAAGPGPGQRQLGPGPGDPAAGVRGLGALPPGGHRQAEPAPPGRRDRRKRVLLHPPRQRNRVPAPGGGQLPGPFLRAARGRAVPARRRLRRHRHHGLPAGRRAGRAARRTGQPTPAALRPRTPKRGSGRTWKRRGRPAIRSTPGWSWKAAGGWARRSSTSGAAPPGRCP